MSESVESVPWFLDDPLDSANERPDALGRDQFYNGVVDVINGIGAQASSTVMALIGPWGSGKTSLVNLIRRDLQSESAPLPWKLVDFNPWNYQDQASLQIGFFVELSGAQPKRLGWTNARRRLAAFGNSIAPLASIGALAGFNASELVRGASSLLAGNRSPSVLRRKAEKSLRRSKFPILVILDDLDRLDPEELLLVFKLVRLVGRLPNVHYLLCYDEASLEDLLSRTGLVGGEPTARSRDYLEKVVQVRLDLPILRDSQALGLTNARLGELLGSQEVELTELETQRFSRLFFSHLSARLTTPRAINRYFAQLSTFFRNVHREVDVIDYLLLTWIRTAEPGVYALLQRRKSDLVGYRRSFGRRDDSVLNSEQAEWRAEIVASGTRVQDVAGVAAVLSDLFPAFHAAWRAKEHTSSNSGPRRVAHPDYFDRYFNFGVPPEDIADSEVSAAIDQINSGEEQTEARRFTLMLSTDPALIASKLLFAHEAQQLDPRQFLIWLADNFLSIQTVNDLLTPQDRLRGLAGVLMQEVREEHLARLLQRMCQSQSGLVLTTFAYASLRGVGEDGVPGRETQELDRQMGAALARGFEANANIDAFEFPSHLWSLIWLWQQIHAESAGVWIEQQLRSARWTLLDTVSKFVGTSRLVGGVGPSAVSLADLDTALIDRLLGINRVLTELSAQIDGATDRPPERHELPPTPDNRRLLALAALKRLRAKIRSGESTEPG